MAQPMTGDERIRELHDRAVTELVAAHARRTDEPLVLAVRYSGRDPFDVHLLEVLADFPGADDDELLATEFEPSAQLRILGKLHLTLGSPSQLRAAAGRGDAIIADIRRGTVVFDDHSDEATGLKALLEL
ncbi:MAG: hypothetical protein HY825_19085 [Acidobacteria bacterium]|nr:hypothetical protein [Acidobacteriota bacterium]